MTGNTDYWNQRHSSMQDPKGVSDYGHAIEPLFPRGSVVCDLGGGQGRDSLYFLEHGHFVTLFDISALAVEQAQKFAKEKNLLLTAQELDLSLGEIPLPDNSQDVVYSHLALHYFDRKNTQKLLNEIRRCLKPSGKAFLAVKAWEDEQEMLYLKQNAKEIEQYIFQDGGETKSRYPKAVWEEMVEELGVSETSVDSFTANFKDRKDKPRSGNSSMLLRDIRFTK
jgi:ubiquinone/menaquinone biosynthesis C-methylase UbiE